MKRSIAEFMAICDICQRIKAEHQRPAGLLQPLKIPEWKWEASARANSVPTLGRVQFMLGPAIVPPNASRSRNLRSTTARGVSRPPRMTPPHHGGPTWRRSLTPM
jgi:hypothetical protein